GLSTLKNTLQKDNFQPASIDMTKGVSLDGCVMIAIVAPADAFRESETRPIVDAVNRGAALLLVVPPEIDLDSKSLRPTGLNPIGALAGASRGAAVAREEDPWHRQP